MASLQFLPTFWGSVFHPCFRIRKKRVRSIIRFRVGHGVVGPRVPLDVGICASLSDTVVCDTVDGRNPIPNHRLDGAKAL